MLLGCSFCDPNPIFIHHYPSYSSKLSIYKWWAKSNLYSIIIPARIETFKQALDVVIHSTDFSTTSRAWTCATLAVMSAMLCERTELTEWFLWYFPHLFPVSTSFATWLETSCNQIPIRNWTLNWNWNCCDVLGSSCEDAIEKKRQSFVNASQNGFKVTFVQICCKPDRTPSFFGYSKVFRFSEDGEENRQTFMLQVLPCVLISSIFFAIHVLHVRKTSQNYASQVGTYEELIPDAVRDPVAPNGRFVPTTGRSKIFQSTTPFHRGFHYG